MELFAVAAPGLEPILANELRTLLGASAHVERGGARWTGDRSSLYRALLHLRTASRVLLRIATFRARGFPELERHARRIEWQRFLPRGTRVLLRVSSRKSRLYHEGAIAERLLSAIGAEAGSGLLQSGDDTAEDDAQAQAFVVRFLRDECTISADAAGGLLHRRGYRQQTAKAPLRETLAAALLEAAAPDARAPLMDPFCGAGTIPIEAALRARRIPPGLAGADRAPRNFRCLHWPDFDAHAWRNVIEDARAAILPSAPAPIVGSDRDAGAIAAARVNATRAGVEHDVLLEQRALSDAVVPAGVGAMITNPPYGLRVGERNRLRDLYGALGSFALRRLPGWTIGMLCADRRLCGHTGLPFERALSTHNGGIGVELLVARVPRA